MQLSDYEAALNQAAVEQGRESWNWSPTKVSETQCATAAFDVLRAGGINLEFTGYTSGLIMPNTMNNCLGQLVGQPNSGVSLRK